MTLTRGERGVVAVCGGPAPEGGWSIGGICPRGYCASMPARSAARLSVPGTTGWARYEKSLSSNVRLKTRLPDGLSSVTRPALPHDITQSPPGSLRALPQHNGVATVPGSSFSSPRVAVLAVKSIAYRAARGGRWDD